MRETQFIENFLESESNLELARQLFYNNTQDSDEPLEEGVYLELVERTNHIIHLMGFREDLKIEENTHEAVLAKLKGLDFSMDSTKQRFGHLLLRG